MGTWGPKLYQDDLAVDVRDYYKDQLHRGRSGEEITQELLRDNADILLDTDNVSVFWFALADTQWNVGRLENHVKEKALYYINNEQDIKKWEVENQKEAKIRRKVLFDLEKKLLSPQPAIKKVKQYNLYHCEWKIGDVYAYPLTSKLAKEKKLDNKFLLFYKIDESEWWPGHIIPVVYVKLTKDNILPETEQEFNKLEYVQVSITKWEDRFLPIDMNISLEEQLLKQASMKFETDEYGFLPKFRLELITTSKKLIPKQLTFVKNFKNIIPPKHEFISNIIPSTSWKDLEQTIIERYCGYNLRQYDIYSEYR